MSAQYRIASQRWTLCMANVVRLCLMVAAEDGF